MSYPDDKAIERWTFDDTECYIVRHPSLGHLCGYARFTKRPVREQGHVGVLTYVPVHGGITFANEDDDGSMVYGFDCAHAGDAVEPEFEPDYMRRFRDEEAHVWKKDEVRSETEKMVLWIKAIAKYEAPYLLAATNEEKARILDDYLKEIGCNVPDSFGVCINLLGGQL